MFIESERWTCTNGVSNKEYIIEWGTDRDGHKFVKTSWGRIGGSLQSKYEVFGSDAEAFRMVRAYRAKRVQHGYVIEQKVSEFAADREDMFR